MSLVKKIDIHVHTSAMRGIHRFNNGGTYATPMELRAMYDAIGVEKGVILPGANPECHFAEITNQEAMRVSNDNPESFSWFCNIDPRNGSNSPDTDFTYFLEYYKEKGAKGVGEICANLYFDDPLVLNLFKHCEKCGMPITFHIGNMGGDYGLVDEIGLPRLEKILGMFPKLRFLGHSQKFWAEISGDLTPEQRDGYPTGKVVPGGRVVELMRKYPNLCGDLSAGSGYNAVSRDPNFGYAFFEEFQDKLYYGTDICDPRNITNPMLKLASFLDEGVTQGKISQEAYEKISRKNALKLLGEE
ncbi:MAG: amidohydrolase family protein [Clostridiales bacterium]|nr:amidohydrolase family protein [Clostridiales bacterium]